MKAKNLAKKKKKQLILEHKHGCLVQRASGVFRGVLQEEDASTPRDVATWSRRVKKLRTTINHPPSPLSSVSPPTRARSLGRTSDLTNMDGAALGYSWHTLATRMARLTPPKNPRTLE